jgi:hypothetical protein
MPFPSNLNHVFKQGPGRLSVTELQEVMVNAGMQVDIDGDFGPQMLLALSDAVGTWGRSTIPSWQIAKDIANQGLDKTTGVIDFNRVAGPAKMAGLAVMSRLLEPFEEAVSLGTGRGANLRTTLLAIAMAHLEYHPREIGGNNRGPWVRLYSHGAQGDGTAWCANFAARTVLDQAEQNLVNNGVALPYPRGAFDSGSCTEIAARTKRLGRLVSGSSLARAEAPAHLAITRKGGDQYSHIGVVWGLSQDRRVMSTVEGNASQTSTGPGVEWVTIKYHPVDPAKFDFVTLS